MLGCPSFGFLVVRGSASEVHFKGYSIGISLSDRSRLWYKAFLGDLVLSALLLTVTLPLKHIAKVPGTPCDLWKDLLNKMEFFF